MGSLGDFFPEDERLAHSARALVVGTLVRSPVLDTTPPKYKFWIVVGFADGGTEEMGIVYLNTTPNAFLTRNPVLAGLQIPICHDARNLVDYDCYADCTEIRRKDVAAIRQQLADEPAYVRGHLSGPELALVLNALRTSPRISPRDKRRFGLL